MAHLLNYALWFSGPAVQLCIAVLLWRSGMRRRFPIFFGYLLAQTLSTVIVALSGYVLGYRGYFFAYWTVAIIGIGLGFAVIYEVFQHVFLPYDTLRDFGNVLFRWAALVLLLVAIVSAAAGGNRMDARILQAILTLERSVRVMQCGLVLFLFLFSGYLGISARAHIVGISLGFGIFGAVDLTIVTLRGVFGPTSNSQLTIIKSVAYLATCVLWFLYLRVPEPERRKVEHSLRSTEWNYALSGVVNPPTESFLPMIESAVERILAERESDVERK